MPHTGVTLSEVATYFHFPKQFFAASLVGFGVKIFLWKAKNIVLYIHHSLSQMHQSHSFQQSADLCVSLFVKIAQHIVVVNKLS